MNNKAIYKQYDSRWAKLPFPKGYTISGNGCGCCAVTHVIIELDKYKNYTPAKTQPYMIRYATPDGLYHSGIPASLKYYGLSVIEIGESDPMSKAWKNLSSKGNRAGVLLFYGSKRVGNRRVYIYGPDGTQWTTGGHFIAFVDYKIKDGKHWFYLKDSSPRESTHVTIDGKKVKESHSGWWCYENSMKGCLPKLWIAKIPGEESEKKVETPYYNAIDVSEFQGTIDWAKVKKAGIDAAIIRYGDGTYKDPKFATNMKNAIANGLHVGCYIFSRAKTAKEAEDEATRLFNAAKAYKYDMPLYIDLEAKGYEKYAKTVATAFINKIKALGGKPGVYANLNWWNNYLKDITKMSFAMWLAQYNSTMDFKPAGAVGMWQYTSSGKVDGINGNVDRDRLYVKYWDQKTVASTTTTTSAVVQTWVDKANAHAKKIAADNRFHYNLWDQSIPGTKKCPLCNGCVEIYEALEKIGEVKNGSTGSDVKAVQKFLNYWMGSGLKVDGDCGPSTVKAIKAFQKHYGLTVDGIFGAKSKKEALFEMMGWNCIGLTAEIWHHGGGLGNTCSCHWITGPNGTGDKLLTVSDAEALKLARQYTGLKDIKVIRNKNGIPKDQWKAGDICLKFSGTTFEHAFYYAGNKKIFDSTRIYTDKKKWTPAVVAKQIAERSYDNYSAKVIIRYIGAEEKKDTTPTPSSTPVKKGYSGKLPTLALKKTNAEAIADAVIFGRWIAADNSFHYGYTNKHGSDDPKKWNPNAHHNGCYFCGTNVESGGRSKKGIVDYKKTYCCNPLIGACYAHGAGDSTALALCKKGSSWNYAKGTGYDKSKLFDKLGHPAKSVLKAGDVLCSSKHVAMFIGNGMIVEAASGDDNVRNSAKWNNSIHVTELTDKRYKSFDRVYRYNGKVDVKSRAISHGEVSDRVKLWQLYLNWYFGKDVASADRKFGDVTFDYTKKFQKEQGLTVDGIVGPKTLEAAAKVVK